MKIALFAVLALLPVPVAAQSLDDTHERVWHPSGKTPMLHYRLRDRVVSCASGTGHHQAGKTPLPAKSPCIAEAQGKPDTRTAAAASHPLSVAAD